MSSFWLKNSWANHTSLCSDWSRGIWTKTGPMLTLESFRPLSLSSVVCFYHHTFILLYPTWTPSQSWFKFDFAFCTIFWLPMGRSSITWQSVSWQRWDTADHMVVVVVVVTMLVGQSWSHGHWLHRLQSTAVLEDLGAIFGWLSVLDQPILWPRQWQPIWG